MIFMVLNLFILWVFVIMNMLFEFMCGYFGRVKHFMFPGVFSSCLSIIQFLFVYFYHYIT